ncbi:MAG: T9SS type A sorting domain-containing protein [Agriterribacter sp.]
MKKLLLICLLLTCLNNLFAQSDTDPAVDNGQVTPSPVGGVGSTFTISFSLDNRGIDDISGADAANKVSLVIKLQKCVPDFTAPDNALNALSGTALDLFDFTYNATDTQYTALQKTNTPMEGFTSGKTYQLQINSKVAKLSDDNSLGAILTITPPGSSTFNQTSNDVGTALTRSSVTLPVRLASFTAITRNCTVQLNWATITQEKFSYFEVGSSFDGKNFSSFQTVQSKSSHESSVYQLITSSVNADTYYRLKMVDVDGKYEYSDVLKVKNACNASALNVVPNPVTNNVFTIRGLQALSVIKLLDMNGKTLRTVRSPGPIQQMDMGNLPAGIYLVHILQNDEIIKTVKLLKK